MPISSNSAKVIVLVGRAGAGKSTISEALAKKAGVPVFHTGAFIRAEIKAQTPAGIRAQKNLTAHGFFPPELIIAWLESQIQKNPKKFQNGFVLDGFPRSIHHISSFEKFMQKFNFKLAQMVYLDIPAKTSIRRMQSRSRKTGEPEPLDERRRQTEFEAQAQPLLAYFGSRGKVVRLSSLRLPVKKTARKLAQPLRREKHQARRAKALRRGK